MTITGPTTSSPVAPDEFDVTAPLPPGTTALEASAGTGKTYAIVGLAARLIADGMPIDRLLLVTFSRAATAELRERMRERVRELVDALDGGPRPGDALARHLVNGSPGEVVERRSRLVAALSDFDASTIATTHTFCNRMLDALGFLGERELVHELVEDVSDLVAEAAGDLYLRGYADGRVRDMSASAAADIAKQVMLQPAAQLAPTADDLAGDEGPDATIARRRVRFAARIREIVEERKQSARRRTYDDLQLILLRIVTDPEIGDAACERIRSAFDAVLVDEFQDTDPQQWEIVKRCFHGSRTLVLVGDPKQSIYGFRGADVLSYLDAVGDANGFRVLGVNHRSDGDLVKGLGGLYEGAELGHPQIVIRPVGAARRGSCIHGVPPVRLRVVPNNSFTRHNKNGLPPIDVVRQAVIDDVAADIAGLLTSGTAIEVDGRTRPVQPGDIAILVTKNSVIEKLQRALGLSGVAAVMGAGTSVFHTAAAHHWLAVIRAVEQPARDGLVRAAAATPLIGWSVEELALDDGAGVARLAAVLQELARVYADGGFAALSRRLMARMGVAERVLSTHDGERLLTDLIQTSALCNAEVMATDCGLGVLGEWLAERIADRASRRAEQTRRLDRDTEAVQIMTVHRSKGLEFPIVYLPFGWDGTRAPDGETFTFHDESSKRFIDVGGENAPGQRQRLARHDVDLAGDDLRLLYVALTRARSQVTMWWAPAAFTERSSLHRLLFGRAAGSAVIAATAEIPDDDTVSQVLSALAPTGGPIRVENAGGTRMRHTLSRPPREVPADLSAAVFDRQIDQSWRRTSYSAIVAGAAHGPAPILGSGSEPDDDLVTDEPVIDEVAFDDGDPGGGSESALGVDVDETIHGTPSLMNDMPFGAAFGTLVHEVLEYVDTDAPDITGHVRELCDIAIDRRMLDVDVDRLASALVGVLTTPLGFGDLWSISPRNRLAEMDFEFPLAGGVTDSGSGRAVTMAAVADLMDRHLDPDDVLAGYAGHLRDLPPQDFRGYLTGSIDSVLRLDSGRFVIVDYKTNRLHAGARSAEDFSRTAMAAEMIGANYPLQAMLYSVALHRYLRWRLPGYQAADHLGAVQYHFVRGMVGPQTPPGCGVFEWELPPTLVEALSELLGEGT